MGSAVRRSCQTKAVNDLMTYIQTQATFFAKAIGLPKQVLVNDLTAHVLQLKGALDDGYAEAVRKGLVGSEVKKAG